MKITKELVWKYREEVLDAYNYYWGEDALPADINLIRGFFGKCDQMDYAEFITKVTEEYGSLLADYRQAKQMKSLASIKGIMIFFLVMYLVGTVVGTIVLLA